MIDTNWMLDDMMNDVRPDFSDISKYDLNGDGQLTVDDCPFEMGSPKAQWWFSNILKPYTQQQVTEEVTEKFGDKQVVGVYKGKALIPGDQNDDLSKQHGALDYVKDRLMVTKGMSPQGAARVAQLIKNPVYMVNIP